MNRQKAKEKYLKKRELARAEVGIAKDIVGEEIYSDAYGYLVLANGNLCDEHVSGSRITYICFNNVENVAVEYLNITIDLGSLN